MPKEKLETTELKDVEILAPGTWNGNREVKIPEDAMQAFVESFDELSADAGLNYEPPAKLGHDEGQKILQSDGYPAAGWVSKLRVKAGRLCADFRGVPKKLAEILKAGGYKKVSAEFYQDYDIGGKKYPWVLKAVAFLGADIPAVKSIADIAAQYAEGVLLDENSVPYLAVIYDKGGQAADNTRNPNQNREAVMESEIRKALGLSEGADVLAALSSLKAQAGAKAEAAVSLAEMTALQTKVNDLTAQLAERARDERVGKAIQAGKITPAQKAWADKYALSSPAEFDAFVTAAPVVVPLGEVGNSLESETALTESEIRMGERLGVSREDLIKTKKNEKTGGK